LHVPHNTGDEWYFRAPGAPREEVERIRGVLELAGTLIGWGGVPSRVEPLDLPTAEAALTAAQAATTEALIAGGPGVADNKRRAELVALLTKINQSQIALRDAVLAHKSAAVEHVVQALRRLREVTSVRELMERAPKEMHGLGFDRGLMSRIVASRWVTETCYVDKDPEFAELIVQAGQADPALLDDRLLETEMARSGMPIVVNNPVTSPRTHHSLVQATETRSYVGAPIMCNGAGFGFMHADGYSDGRRLDTFDRDTLGMFAEGFGFALERTMLAERLLALRGRMDEYSSVVTDLIDQFVESDLRHRSSYAAERFSRGASP
jgi:GAF domain-containing protein